jgi:hypothetical protein
VCSNGVCINPCAGGNGPGYETWTQYCGGHCVPEDALCCGGDYWCWWPGSLRCCHDQRTCRMHGDPSPCSYNGQDLR